MRGSQASLKVAEGGAAQDTGGRINSGHQPQERWWGSGMEGTAVEGEVAGVEFL
jgi:hypothetical protein